jgi:hypothetical protein
MSYLKVIRGGNVYKGSADGIDGKRIQYEEVKPRNGLALIVCSIPLLPIALIIVHHFVK